MRIGIQGGPASFHDIAANDFFDGVIETISFSSFRSLTEHLANGELDYAIMAIENSIAGPILLNYRLIEEFEVNVVGEYKLQIKQNLMALPGQKVEDISKVYSHYMAIGQCLEYLREHPKMEAVEYYDTADAARMLREYTEMGSAAIAGDKAAELYELEILEEGINTIKQNYTRFLILSRDKVSLNGSLSKGNKASISFELPHKVGSLAEALGVIVEHGVNLSMIQSVPIVGKPDQYTFYLDCEWPDGTQVAKCFVKLRQIIHNLKILGEYSPWIIDYDNIPS